ncbi:melatonin receptor type 1B-A-like [Patiria miniata]|uniref:G-protein coupled receptors family 1 profile domain-containing protein n=1 Tax=Patiria miniata TaxID=46514 RepID=A0A913YZI5_PATMI|nr:melatonin receptor type 1B-A-like [Patiria miniata]
MDNSTTNSTSYEFSDYTQRAIVATLFLIVSLVGIIGNSLVIIAVLLSKVLQTTTIAFIVNMSTAHLMCSLVLPWDVVALLSTGDLPRGDREWLCSVTTVVVSITIGCGIYTLASLALNHLLLIARPTTTYLKIFTPKKIAVWLMVTWLIPIFVILLPPLINLGEVGFNDKFHLCGTKSSDQAKFIIYNFIRVFGLYPIPLLCIIVCYALIWAHLRRHIGETVSSVGDDTPTNKGIPMEENLGAGIDSARSSSASLDTISPTHMINKTMPFVVGGFIVLLLPYAVCLFISSFEPAVPYATTILFSSCCVNPIFYGIRHRDFKNVFGCILRRRWNDIPQPSPFLKATRRIQCCSKRSVVHADEHVT